MKGLLDWMTSHVLTLLLNINDTMDFCFFLFNLFIWSVLGIFFSLHFADFDSGRGGYDAGNIGGTQK